MLWLQILYENPDALTAGYTTSDVQGLLDIDETTAEWMNQTLTRRLPSFSAARRKDEQSSKRRVLLRQSSSDKVRWHPCSFNPPHPAHVVDVHRPRPTMNSTALWVECAAQSASSRLVAWPARRLWRPHMASCGGCFSTWTHGSSTCSSSTMCAMAGLWREYGCGRRCTGLG